MERQRQVTKGGQSSTSWVLAWQPVVQALRFLCRHHQSCSPPASRAHGGQQPRMASVPAAVNLDLRASRGSQTRSVPFHGGARFSKNDGNYTYKNRYTNTKSSAQRSGTPDLELSMQLQVNSTTLTHYKAVPTTYCFFSPQVTIFSCHRKLTVRRDPPAELSDVLKRARTQ